MTTFKDFLLTESDSYQTRTKEISYEEAKKILKQHCTEFLKSNNDFPIFRGIDQDIAFGFVDPSKSERASANTSNHYTLLVDNSPNWKTFPKRSKSIICSSDEFRAQDFGNVFAVIPFDGAKIGVCSKYDFWDSFPYLEKEVGALNQDFNMEEFNWQLENFYQYYMKDVKGASKNLSDKNWQEMKTNLVDLVGFVRDSEIKNPPDTPLGKYLHNKIKNENKSLILTLQDLLDPSKNKFRLFNNTSISKVKSSVEVWTDSPCVLFNVWNFVNHVLTDGEKEKLGEEFDLDNDQKGVYNLLRKEVLGK